MLEEVDQWLCHWLPRHCLLCGLTSGRRSICAGCRGDLPWLRLACRRCAAPLPVGASPGCCAQCDLVLTAVDRYRAALAYDYPIDRLISGAKFNRRPELARALGELLTLHLAAGLPDESRPDQLIAVPLHPFRLVQRGFNQAEEIAIPIARRLAIPFDNRSCRRRRNTSAQSGLGGSARRQNVEQAFECRRCFTGQNLAIVDDVVTTGSTASALARVLRAAGAERIEVWSAARVVVQVERKV